ncbi:MAG: AMP-binding protein [Minwuia sp.]|nr:AMP-binding protein [Minwuia sp.]
MNAPWTEDTLQGVLAANRARMAGEDFLTLVAADGSEQSFTYDHVFEAAEHWAARYRASGVSQGDRVVVILRHGRDLYAAYIGAILLGAVPAMFAHPSPKLSESVYFETVRALLDSSRAKLLVTYADLAPKLASLVDALPTFDALLVAGQGEAVTAAPTMPERVDPDAPAFLQYSSGTTGLKKGVTISHRALLWQVSNYGDMIGADDRDVIVSWLPLYHDMGLITCFFLPLIRRCRLVAISPFDWVQRPTLWLDAVSRHRGTLGWMPNFAYSFMARNAPTGDWDLSSMRGLVNCSEPITATSHRAFLDRFGAHGFLPDALAGSYAMAETTFAATSGGFDAPLQVETVDVAALTENQVARPAHIGRELVSSGIALPQTGLTIRGADGSILPDRQVGEIEISSPSLFQSYDGQSGRTAEVLRDGRYLSGDLGYLANGHLFVVGRKRDLIIVGGKNIYPHDVEALACTVDGVLPGRAVALGDADAVAGTERLILIAESDQPEEAWSGIADCIRETIAAGTEIVPADVRIVAPRWLRKSTSGKMARGENLKRYHALLIDVSRHALDRPAVIGTSMAEAVRRVVVDEILAGRPVDDDASLIRSGRIDSFSIVNLILALEQRFGVSIPETVTADPDALDSISGITRTVERLKAGETLAAETSDLTADQVPMITDDPVALPTSKVGFWTWYYRFTFRRLGIAHGPGLRVLGPILLRPDGDPRNIRLGRSVTLMPWVDLKVREDGRIILGDGAAVDTTARLVAARDGTIHIGDRAQVAFSSIINAGADVTIGRDSATAGHCTIIASEHRFDSREPIMRQGYVHEPVLIGADVWLASGVTVTPGSRIGNGAIISARSTVSGDIPGYTVAAGTPARVIKRRG